MIYNYLENIRNYLSDNNFLIDKFDLYLSSNKKIDLFTKGIEVIEINLDNIDCTNINLKNFTYNQRRLKISEWLIELILYLHPKCTNNFLFTNQTPDHRIAILKILGTDGKYYGDYSYDLIYNYSTPSDELGKIINPIKIIL